MSGRSKIRWKQSDDAELNRLIKNFNAKLTRLSKSRPEDMPYMPDRVSKKELMKNIETRADLNTIKRRLANFTKRGSEEIITSKRGAKATKYDVHEFNVNQRRENKRREERKKELDKKEVTITGKGTGVTRAQMREEKQIELLPSKKNFQNMSQGDWEKSSKLFDKLILDSYSTRQKEEMLQNYIKGLVREGFSEDVINVVQHVPLDKFVDTVMTDETATFDFIYDPIELKAREEELISLWSQFEDQYTDHSIDVSNMLEERLFYGTEHYAMQDYNPENFKQHKANIKRKNKK